MKGERAERQAVAREKQRRKNQRLKARAAQEAQAARLRAPAQEGAAAPELLPAVELPPPSFGAPRPEPVVVREAPPTSPIMRVRGEALPKAPPLRSPTMLAWCRAQPAVLSQGIADHAHHFPVRGRDLVYSDLLVMPVTAEEHEICHRRPRQMETLQEAGVFRTIKALFTRAEHRQTLMQVLRELLESAGG